ncbi:hypothetical protein AYI69_g5017, partial [Smittium culicis]
MCQDAHIQEP